MTVDEYIEQERRAGGRYHRTGDVWWERRKRGAWVAIPVFRTVRAGEMRPRWTKAWGAYQHAVPSGTFGNSIEGVMVLRAKQEYALEHLSPNKRSHVRRGLRRVEVQPAYDVEHLVWDGFEINRSALIRQGREEHSLEFNRWAAGVRATFGLRDREEWGAFANGRLVAYLRSYLLEDIMYVSTAMSHTDSLALYPNDALLHRFLESCRNRDDVREVIHGLWSGKPSLDDFKLGFGFSVVRVPFYRWINSALRPLLRLTRYRHYLGRDGHDVASVPPEAMRGGALGGTGR